VLCCILLSNVLCGRYSWTDLERSVLILGFVFTMKKGFTLIELLVVIAILAVLATAVVLILNPAELLKQARDSTRLSDTASVHSALALYLADVVSPSWSALGRCTFGVVKPFTQACTTSALTNVTGTGWVPVNLGSISTGSPLSRLPIDPINDVTHFYAYAQTASLTYEINANMESAKFANGGGGDVETTDGGSNANWYEIGNDPGLDL